MSSMRNQVMAMIYQAPEHSVKLTEVIEELAKTAGERLPEISATLTGLLVKGEVQLDEAYLRLPS